MGQVPKYVIVGDGRLARHMAHYFSLLQLPYVQWSRSCASHLPPLAKRLHPEATVLLLISDAAIESFVESHPYLKAHILVHCSGCLVTKVAMGAHPLMTFGVDLYSQAQYERIPWVLDETALSFSTLFPGLSNPHYRIPVAEKAYYHALCVMANNFTTVLWSKFFDTLHDRFQIEKKDVLPMLQQTMLNLSEGHQNALTGPLVRGDLGTIDANLASLSKDAFRSVYEGFLEAYGIERGKS